MHGPVQSVLPLLIPDGKMAAVGRGNRHSMPGITTNRTHDGPSHNTPDGGRFWTDEDRQAVGKLVENIRRVEQHAFETGDRPLIADAHSLLSGLVQLYDLLTAFRNSPDGRIKGPQGVAKKLGLTRNGVYCRLEMVGLDPEDLRNPPGDVRDLVARSRIFGPLADRLQNIAGSI